MTWARDGGSLDPRMAVAMGEAHGFYTCFPKVELTGQADRCV